MYDKDLDKITKNPNIAGYNCDIAEGISYKIDVTHEVGERIKDVIFLKSGELVEKEKIYKVALNSYRASGGGGHLAAAEIQKANILWKSSEEMRNILADYIQKIGEIDRDVDHNWEIIKK